MNRKISEQEFRALAEFILFTGDYGDVGCVTGPGRSGAVAAVYASHFLRIPFIPFGAKAPEHLERLLIIDTATQSGKTLKKATRKYKAANPLTLAIYNEPPRVFFWYERDKPQTYKHETTNADRRAEMRM